MQPKPGAQSTVPPAQQTPALLLQGTSKRFADQTVLRDIDLSVHPGEFVGLVGPSGAGKSTLLRLLNAMHRVDSGTVHTLGKDVTGCSRRELRQLRARVGFIFQNFGLVGRLTAMENVLTGALASLRWPRYGVVSYPRALRVRALEHLDRVGLADRRFQRCDTLSGGQQQRIAVARTLMQEPEIILADEPIASLDPAASARILDILERINRENDISIVCSLHQIEFALQKTRRIVALADGRVVLDEPSETLTRQRLHAIYDSSELEDA